MINSPLSEPDHYAVLGVAPDATPGEIERAYRLQAGRRLNPRWRPGKAGRELAQINAAYGVLRYPERRADYDRRRAEAKALAEAGVSPPPPPNPRAERALQSYRRDSQRRLPLVQVGRPSGGSPADAAIIVLVVVFAIFIGSLFASRETINLSFLTNLGETLGLTRRRAAATPSASPTPFSAPAAAASPAAVTPTPAQPPTPVGALPTAVAGMRYAGSQVSLSTTEPPRRSNLTVTLTLLREGQPVPNANVFLVAHYRTVQERQPPGTSTVRTDANGQAAISFNIGDATVDHQVNVDVTALVEGQQVVFQTSFTPR